MFSRHLSQSFLKIFLNYLKFFLRIFLKIAQHSSKIFSNSFLSFSPKICLRISQYLPKNYPKLNLYFYKIFSKILPTSLWLFLNLFKVFTTKLSKFFFSFVLFVTFKGSKYNQNNYLKFKKCIPSITSKVFPKYS